MQSRSDSNLWGIDVSHYQGDIDWKQVKDAGVVFAFVKATEGVGITDGKFRRNSGGANAVGLAVGYYHYAHPELNNAQDEVNAFLEVVKDQPCQMPYVLDLEGAAGNLDRFTLTQWAVTWLQEVKRITGKHVMLYTGAYFARDNVNTEMGEFPLWIAHYGTDTPLANSTWDRWSVFQVSSGGGCPGINGLVDTNLMEADFYWQVTQTPQPVEPPAEQPNTTNPYMSPEYANYIIDRWISHDYEFASQEDQDRRHFLANQLRLVSGQPEQ